MAEGKDIAVGIDLGTTLSCVAVAEGDRVTIIHNEVGSRVTPSWIWFDNDDRKKHIVGDYAKSNVVIDPTNTVYGNLYIQNGISHQYS